MEIDFILGQYFRDMADATYAPMPKSPNAWEEGDYDSLPNTFDIGALSKVKDRPFIIYTHTMYAHLLLPILAEFKQEFVLVTHNSDCFVADEGIGFKDGLGHHWKTERATIPPNVIKWYSANVNTLQSKIEAIPTGLANEWWSPEVKKRDKMCEKWNETRIVRNLVYMDHNFVQNPEERKVPYDVLGDKPWVTAQREGLNFPKFLDNVYNHTFVICPRGNGMGTHREWETLYMGSYPIMLKDLNNRFYTDLPFVFVDEWSDITEEFLHDEYLRIKSREWKMEMLTFTYWKNKIRNTR